MADDIVGQLREAASIWKGGRVKKMVLDAADEIERLRAVVTELLSWAEIGTQAVQAWDGYESDVSGQGIDRAAGLRLFERIDAGEFDKFMQVIEETHRG